jgi:hypothetical protein
MKTGCAVCGQLTPLIQVSRLSKSRHELKILSKAHFGFTQCERLLASDPIQEIKGPIIDNTCTNICHNCYDYLQKKTVPKYALAKGLWLGSVPSQLQNLSFAEQLFIACI